MMMRVLMATVLLAAGISGGAMAQDDSTPFTYAPAFCEFEVQFPEEPYKARRCRDAGQTDCYELTSYTHVYGLDATVNFRVICNPMDENIVDDYSPEVMKATLKALKKDTVTTTHDNSFREGEGYKQASYVGEGVTGRTPMIYIGQLWIGAQSALTVEAELIGEAHDEADILFGEILRSVRPKINTSEQSAAVVDKADQKASTQ